MNITITAKRAADLYPQLARITDRQGGTPWTFGVDTVDGARLLLGHRTWPNRWNDAIAVLSRNDAKAFRCDPEGGEVWGKEGGLIEVVKGLLELPAPDAPGAPRLVKGTSPKLWIPGTQT